MVFMVRLKVRLFLLNCPLKLQSSYSTGDRGKVQLRYAYSESSCTLGTLMSAGNARAVVSPLFPLMLRAQVLLDLYALVELFNTEIANAKKAESEGGDIVTPQEWLAISIAVGAPALKQFLVPQLPDETIDAATQAITRNQARVSEIRTKAATILDRAKTMSGALVAALEDA